MLSKYSPIWYKGWILFSSPNPQLAVCQIHPFQIHLEPFPSLNLFFSLLLYYQQTGIHLTQSHLECHSQTRKTTGPNTDSCWTPLVTLLHSDVSSLAIFLCFLFPSYSLNQQGKFPVITVCTSRFCSSLLLGTVSNTLPSQKKQSPNPSLSLACFTSFCYRILTGLVRQDLPSLNQCWLFFLKELLSRCSNNSYPNNLLHYPALNACQKNWSVVQCFLSGSI